jgi:hypothetical protein
VCGRDHGWRQIYNLKKEYVKSGCSNFFFNENKMRITAKLNYTTHTHTHTHKAAMKPQASSENISQFLQVW